MSLPSVLSFGFTRGLWDGDAAEDVRRMRGYAEHLAEYVVVTNSYKRHRLQPLRLAQNFEAIPTDAFHAADSFLRMLAIGRRVLRERRIDLIQAQDPFYTGLAAILLARGRGLPVNVCVYGPNVYDPHWLGSHWSHGLLGRIGRWVLRRAANIQVDGRMTARSLIAAGHAPEQVAVKPMVPANLDHFLSIERSASSGQKTVRLLFVGRLAVQKNLPLLLAVVQRLQAAGCPAFTLTIVGDGPEEASLRALAAREDLASLVKFQGPVSREEIVEVFAASDVFVLTSDYEGFPRVLMEAAAAALPTVTTAISGSDEAIHNGETGFVTAIGAGEELAEKLRLLIGNPALRQRMGAAAREHARTRLDPAGNTAGQLAIWRRLVAPASGPACASTLHPEEEAA